MKKRNTFRMAAIPIGIAVLVFAGMVVYAVLPRTRNGTAQRVEDVPEYGPALAGLGVSGPVRYHVWETGVRDAKNCVISGRCNVASVSDWVATRRSARLDVEDVTARDLSAFVSSFGLKPADFNVKFDHDLLVIGTDPDFVERRSVPRHVELYVRKEDGAFLLLSW